MKIQEHDTFKGFKTNCGNVVAEFQPSTFGGKPFILDKATCEARLEYLRREGRPHDQTAIAVKNWPEYE